MTDRNPIVVSKSNWPRYINRIGEHFFRKMGFHPHDRDRVYFTALEFVGEAGELANVIKKIWRESGNPSPELLAKVRDEWADCRMLLDRIGKQFDLDGDQVCANKVEELFVRWSFIEKTPHDVEPIFKGETV